MRRFGIPLHIALGFLVALFGAMSGSSSFGGYKDDIGFTALSSELGSALANGTGVVVTQVEAPLGGAYLPDITLSELSTKNITNVSGSNSSASSHATTVGTYFYGNVTSIAPGIQDVRSYEVNDWLTSGYLQSHVPFASFKPLGEVADVQNHSWIGTYGNASLDSNVLRRLDYAIERDDFLVVAGLNNGASTSVPNLLGSLYNGLSVGRTDGAHSSGTTGVDEPGRVRPDIVAPADATSWATPIVGSAGGVLLSKAKADALLANATHSETTKAILMAGATKSEFGSAWDRTSTRPLDERFGAGELNIQNSYHVLVAGEHDASGLTLQPLEGWDFATITSSDLIYYFEIPAGQILDELSAVLTWNRIINPDLTPTLSNLDLRLYSASAFSLGSELDASVSDLDNVEHIWWDGGLGPGHYALRVSKRDGSQPDADVGVAWRVSTVVPEPSVAGYGILWLATLGCLRRRLGRW